MKRLFVQALAVFKNTPLIRGRSQNEMEIRAEWKVTAQTNLFSFLFAIKIASFL